VNCRVVKTANVHLDVNCRVVKTVTVHLDVNCRVVKTATVHLDVNCRVVKTANVHLDVNCRVVKTATVPTTLAATPSPRAGSVTCAAPATAPWCTEQHLVHVYVQSNVP
jgi:hypothetical protein